VGWQVCQLHGMSAVEPRTGSAGRRFSTVFVGAEAEVSMVIPVGLVYDGHRELIPVARGNEKTQVAKSGVHDGSDRGRRSGRGGGI
jgi:hypothetical protein